MHQQAVCVMIACGILNTVNWVGRTSPWCCLLVAWLPYPQSVFLFLLWCCCRAHRTHLSSDTCSRGSLQMIVHGRPAYPPTDCFRISSCQKRILKSKIVFCILVYWLAVSCLFESFHPCSCSHWQNKSCLSTFVVQKHIICIKVLEKSYWNYITAHHLTTLHSAAWLKQLHSDFL